MPITRKPLSSDPAKPVYIICKRIILILSTWDPSNVCNSNERVQLREDGQSISDSIVQLLTKIKTPAQRRISTLKRLHLAPEQIRHDIDMILYTNSPDKIKSCIKAINQVLKDVEAISMDGITTKDFNDNVELGPSADTAKGGLVGQSILSTPVHEDRTSSSSKAGPYFTGKYTDFQKDNIKEDIETQSLNLTEDFGMLTLEFEKALNSNTKHDKYYRSAENQKSKIRVISDTTCAPIISETQISKSILQSNSESSQESCDTIQVLEVFLKYQNLTVKSKWAVDDGIEGLKTLFCSNFKELTSNFKVLVQDPSYNKFYLLTDIKEICNGSLLTIQQGSVQKEVDKFQILGKKLDRLSGLVETHLFTTGNISNEEGIKDQKNDQLKEYLGQISELKNDLQSLKTLAQTMIAKVNESVASQLLTLKNAFKKRRVSEIDQVVADSNSLMDDFKEFMFFLDTTRQDLTRKVRPGEIYKTQIETKLETLLARQSDLRRKLTNLKGRYKKQWEASLQSVLSEQQVLSELFDKLGDIDEVSTINVDLANTVLPVLRQQLENDNVVLKKPQITVWSADQVKNYGIELIVAELAEKDYNIDRSHVPTIVEAQKKHKVQPENPFLASLNSAKLKSTGGYRQAEYELQLKQKKILKELFIAGDKQ
ncbi:Bud site selection protein 6 [Boothiomyces sp. JEL0866]|nr:Bud site selection protein 6 [Boothiomyces sp. JEL0866]